MSGDPGKDKKGILKKISPPPPENKKSNNSLPNPGTNSLGRFLKIMYNI